MTCIEKDKPFNHLPNLPPPCDFETPSILKAAIRAHRELAELKGAGSVIPNQAMLLQLFALHEAKLSSEIENIATTDDELYRAFGERLIATDAQTKEVLGYKDALWYGYNAIKEKGRLLTNPLFCELVDIITNGSSEIRSIPGTKLVNSFGETVYTPPDGKELTR